MTLHGTTMIFLWIIPVFSGFGNYFVPLMIGARDMAFPRINAFSYWLIPLGGLTKYSGLLTKTGAAAAGWTGYVPLTEKAYAIGIGQDLWILGLHILGISSIMGAINFLVTIHNMRAPGMTWFRLPLFVWSIEITAALSLLASPFLAGVLGMVLMDRHAVGRLDQVHVGDALCRGLRPDVLDGRRRWGLHGVAGRRLPDPRHLLGRVAHPLRALRRQRLRGLRRLLLLVSEDDRPLPERNARQDPVLAATAWLQPDLHADAFPRARRHAAPNRDVVFEPDRLGALEPAGDVRCVHDRARHPDLHREFRAQHSRWPAGPHRPLGREHAGVGDDVAATGLQLRQRAACSQWTSGSRPPPRRDGGRGTHVTRR